MIVIKLLVNATSILSHTYSDITKNVSELQDTTLTINTYTVVLGI